MYFRTCLLTLLVYQRLVEKSTPFFNFLQLLIYYINIAYYNKIVNRENRKSNVLFQNVSRETLFLFLPIIIRKKGGQNVVYIVTALFILLDMVTGLIKAFKEKKYTSTVMREGLFHKCGSVLLVIFGVLVDYAQTFIDIGVTIPVTIAICSYIILMEVGSIIENLGKINPDIIPSKIKPFFSKLKEGE